MLYQLPNGRVIYLSVEQYLSLTPQDIRDLNSLNYGEYPGNSPFYGSTISKHSSSKSDPYDTDGLDYKADSEEVEHTVHVNIIHEEDLDSSSF